MGSATTGYNTGEQEPFAQVYQPVKNCYTIELIINVNLVEQEWARAADALRRCRESTDGSRRVKQPLKTVLSKHFRKMYDYITD